MNDSFDIPGVSAAVTRQEIIEALEILDNDRDHSVMVRQPLRAGGNPLQKAPYRDIAATERAAYPADIPKSYSADGRQRRIRDAFTYYLKRRLGESPLPVDPPPPAPGPDYDELKRQEAAITMRRGQGEFRQQLLQAYSRECAVTGYDAVPALQAAHIMPHKGEKSNTPRNGLLLRADIHDLFDEYLLAIHPDSRTVVLSECLKGTLYQTLDGVQLATPEPASMPDREALAWRWDRFLSRKPVTAGVAGA